MIVFSIEHFALHSYGLDVHSRALLCCSMTAAMFSLTFFFLAAGALFAAIDYDKALAQVKPSLISRTYTANVKVHPEQ